MTDPQVPAAAPTAPVAEPAHDAEKLTARAKLGYVVLGARTVLHQFLVFGGNLMLSRLLTPAEFGTFGLVQFAFAFFMIYGDAGLAASLVQKKEHPTQGELSTIFWAQSALFVCVVGVVWSFADAMGLFWKDMPGGAPDILRVLSLGLLTASLRTVPSILLERSLRFVRLSIVDLTVETAYYATAVTLAWRGHGARSLLAAVLVQGVLGMVLTQVMRPWWPSFTFDVAALRRSLGFGVAYQTKGVISFVNDALTPLYGGRVLGAYTYGLINWAQSTAYFPLKLIDVVSRVNFPLFSRLRSDPARFAKILETSIEACALATLFYVGLVFGVGRQLVSAIFSDQWLPAMPALHVYTVAIVLGFFSPLAAGALDALGKPQIIMRLSFAWTALNWIVVSIVMRFSPTLIGFAVAYCVHVVVGNIATLWAVRQELPHLRIAPRFGAGLVAALATASLGRLLLSPWLEGSVARGLAGATARFGLAGWQVTVGKAAVVVPSAVLPSALVFLVVVLAVDRSAVDALRALTGRRPRGEGAA